MVSAGRVEQLGIEIAMLKRENELCMERIEGTSPDFRLDENNGVEYKRVLFRMDEDLEKVIGVVKMYQSRYGELE